jgi:hypothetical protein
MPRPKISEPRNRQFNLSLTGSELEDIRRRAFAVGMRPVHFGRALLLDRNRTVPQSHAADNVVRLIHSQLVRLGNNLNQMMRHLHRTGEPVPTDLAPLLADIRKIVARVTRDDC